MHAYVDLHTHTLSTCTLTTTSKSKLLESFSDPISDKNDIFLF